MTESIRKAREEAEVRRVPEAFRRQQHVIACHQGSVSEFLIRVGSGGGEGGWIGKGMRTLQKKEPEMLVKQIPFIGY